MAKTTNKKTTGKKSVFIYKAKSIGEDILLAYNQELNAELFKVHGKKANVSAEVKKKMFTVLTKITKKHAKIAEERLNNLRLLKMSIDITDAAKQIAENFSKATKKVKAAKKP